MSKVEAFKSVFIGITIESLPYENLNQLKDLLVKDFERVGEKDLEITVRSQTKENKGTPLIEVGTTDDTLSVWVGSQLLFLSAHERPEESIDALYRKLSLIIDTDTFDELVVSKTRVADRASIELSKEVIEQGTLGRLSPLLSDPKAMGAASIQYSVSKDKHHDVTYKYEATLVVEEDDRPQLEFEALHVIEPKATARKVRDVVGVLQSIDVAAEVDDGIERARKSLA